MKLSTIITTTRLLSGESNLLRRLSTATSTALPRILPENPTKINRWKLHNKLLAIDSKGQKLTDVIRQLTENGAEINPSALFFCVKKFRDYGFFNQCLEILDWMEERVSVGDRSYYSLRLDLIRKVKGMDEAEKYFDNLHPDLKKVHMYGTLLNCYCSEKMIDKALTLFEKMKEMNFAMSWPFNTLMSLYIELNQPEKVLPLIQEMKQKNVYLNSISYQIWIKCHCLLNDLEGLEQVVDEAERQEFITNDWSIYSNIASAYITMGQNDRAAQALRKMEMVNPSCLDRDGYHQMISLYASVGSSESVYRVWDKLNSKFTARQNRSYTVMLEALSKLGDTEGLKNCFKEWELMRHRYDVKTANVALSCFLKHNMVDDAELLLQDIKDKSSDKPWKSHVIFMDHYLKKRQTGLLLKHVGSAIANEWKPRADRTTSLCEYLREEKDVEGAEKLLWLLNKVQLVNSETYLWLLQVYATAGKTSPNLRQRMQKRNVNISAEHEELLDTVCPKLSEESNV